MKDPMTVVDEVADDATIVSNTPRDNQGADDKRKVGGITDE